MVKEMLKKILDWILNNFTLLLIAVLLLSFWQRQCDFNSYIKKAIKENEKIYQKYKTETKLMINKNLEKLKQIDERLDKVSVETGLYSKKIKEIKEMLKISNSHINHSDFVDETTAESYLSLINMYEKKIVSLENELNLWKQRCDLLNKNYKNEVNLRIKAENMYKNYTKLIKKYRKRFGILLGGFVNPSGNLSIGLGIGYNIVRF